MKQRYAAGLALGLFACLLIVCAAVARAGTPAIEWWVFASAGAPSGGGAVTIDDTLGQAVIGPSGAGAVSLQAGYRYEHEASLPLLAVSKAAQPSSAKPSQVTTYTIVVSNSGDADATGAAVSDTLPAEVTFAGPVTLDPPGAGTVGTPPTLVTEATITSGGAITVTFPVTLNANLATGMLITNTAAVSCSEVPAPVEDAVAISVDNVAPTLGTVDPSGGSGTTGVTTYFTTTWKDANGWQDLKHCYFHIGDSASIVGSVTLLYNNAKDKLWLRSDDGSAWTGGAAPGDASTLENGQAIVHCSQTTTHGIGDTLSVAWAIEFKPGFEGAKKLGLKCKDRSKARAKGRWKGSWSIE
jgi:uncharacterized repeat protein (TIGR01451 family)